MNLHSLLPQIIKLNTHQLLTLGKLARDHEGEIALISQNPKTKTNLVHVEFNFPVAYTITRTGEAIRQ